MEEPGGEDAEASINRLYITTTYKASPVFDVKFDYDDSMFSSF